MIKHIKKSMHGFDVYQFANCHLYERSWHEGGKQGYGMYTFRNGETKCGKWSGGDIKTSLPPSANAVFRAVQVRLIPNSKCKGGIIRFPVLCGCLYGTST